MVLDDIFVFMEWQQTKYPKILYVLTVDSYVSGFNQHSHFCPGNVYTFV